MMQCEHKRMCFSETCLQAPGGLRERALYWLLTVVVVVFLTLVVAAFGCAEDGRAHEGRSSLSGMLSSSMSSVPDLSRIRLRDLRYSPSAKFGYQRVGMDLAMPMPLRVSLEGSEQFRPDAVRLRLPDADLWIGEAGIDVTLMPSIRLYANTATNLLQSLVASLSGTRDPREEGDIWRNHPLLWIEVEGGVRYFPWESFGMIAGLRWDYFDLTIKNPDPLKTVQVGQYRSVALLPSDVQSRLWIPYAGVEAAGEKFRVFLIASPFAAAKVKATTRLRALVAQSDLFLAESVMTLMRPALFVEVGLDYLITLSYDTKVKIWGKGGWLGAQGGGRLQSAYAATISGLQVEILDDRTMSFDRYNMAGGVSVGLSF